MSVFRQMVDNVKVSWPARRFIVRCLVGPAGIGKTAAVKQAAAELQEEGLATGKVVTIIASQILPNEVSGITMPVVETKAMEIFDHFRLSSLKDGDILFFDELLEADELVLSACLTLIESRELMSGNKLPDVMIVAATNPTIKPNMLKENIRQRFVWKNYDIDRDGCRNYIKETYGFDIGSKIASCIVDKGDEYNILTPRSLTKMAAWISEAGDDKSLAQQIGQEINSIWASNLGTELAEAYLKKLNDPMKQVRNAIRTSITESNVTQKDLENVAEGMGAIMYDDDIFEQTSMTELMEILQKLPEWASIEARLSTVEMVEEDKDNIVNY